MTTLALHGGTPVIDNAASHFTWPPITPAMTSAVLEQLAASISIYDRSGVIADLEDALQRFFAVDHAVLTSSGTAAIHSAYAAVGIEPGDEVIVPAYTFLATVTPLLHLDAIPILADSDGTGNVCAADVESRITPRTAAIMVTHLWGIPADMNALCDLAKRYDLAVLEDASHAHGASIDGRKVGTFGDIGAFSMNGPKPLSAGEGGFVLTNSNESYYRLLMFGHYNKRCRSEIPKMHPLQRYSVTGMGLKFRIHPLAARIALDQLRHLNDYLDGRDKIARYLCTHLGDLPGITVPEHHDGMRAAWYGLPLTYDPGQLDGLPVDIVHSALLAEGLVEVDRPGSTRPLNQLPLFQDPAGLLGSHRNTRFSYRDGEFPVAEHTWAHTLKLPVWHRDEDMLLVDRYIEGFRKVIDNHHELRHS